MAQINGGPSRRRWPASKRAEAIALAQTEGIGPVEVGLRLSVPLSTVQGWLRSAHRDSDDASDLRNGIVRLANRELARLSASPAGKADLRRLEALARILKTTETDRPNRAQAKGLERFAALAGPNGSEHEPRETFGSDGSPRATP
jgi:transposase-like protein